MLTLNKMGGSAGLQEAEFYCLNKDKKPIENVPNGSKLHIIDYIETKVSKDWIFDEENKQWKEIIEVNVGGGENVVADYNQLTNKPSINDIILIGNKTTKDLKLPSLEDIQQLEDNKANYVYKVITTDKVSQTDAREILSDLGTYEGKLIEFLTNGENPSKAVATGRVFTDKTGNNFLITYNLNGTVTQWNKDTFENHFIESYNYTNQVTDLNSLTIDIQGKAPFIATVQNATNKPNNTSEIGNIFIFAYNEQNQMQIYRDMKSGKVYQRLITGMKDNHNFGKWITSEIVGSNDNIFVNADFKMPIITSQFESWTEDDTTNFIDKWEKSNNLNCQITPQGLFCSKGINGAESYIKQNLSEKLKSRLHKEVLCLSLLTDDGVINGTFIYNKAVRTDIQLFENEFVKFEEKTDGQIYIHVKQEMTISRVKLECGTKSTIKFESPMNEELNKLETFGGNNIYLKSPNGTTFKIMVTNEGVLKTEQLI